MRRLAFALSGGAFGLDAVWLSKSGAGLIEVAVCLFAAVACLVVAVLPKEIFDDR